MRVRKIVADMLGIADRLIADAQCLSEKDPAALKKVEAGELRLHAAVAPLRKADSPRRGRKPNPLGTRGPTASPGPAAACRLSPRHRQGHRGGGRRGGTGRAGREAGKEEGTWERVNSER
jgi:hypothetical protein